MSEERSHHPFGPSGWPDKHRCAGYEGDGKSSAAANRGTRIHGYWEQIGTGKTEFPEDIDPEEFVCASWAAGLIKEMAGDHPVIWEERIESKEPEYFGHLDARWVEDDGATVVICDGKSGQSNAEQWIQLVGYAHAYMQDNPECSIAIGRLLYWDMRSIKEYHFTRLEVLNTVNALVEWMKKGERNEGVQCMRCAHWKSCDQIKGALWRGWMAGQSGDSVAMSPEDLAALKIDLDLLENLRKKIGGQLKDMIEDHVSVPGFTLYSRNGSSKIDPLKGWETCKEKISAEDYLSCCKPDVKKLTSMMEMRTGEGLPAELIEHGQPISVLKKLAPKKGTKETVSK